MVGALGLTSAGPAGGSQSLDEALAMDFMVTSDQVPEVGTFWSWQLTNQPPLPYNPFPGLPVYAIGEHVFLFDDRWVDYAVLEMERQALLDLRQQFRGSLFRRFPTVPT